LAAITPHLILITITVKFDQIAYWQGDDTKGAVHYIKTIKKLHSVERGYLSHNPITEIL